MVLSKFQYLSLYACWSCWRLLHINISQIGHGSRVIKLLRVGYCVIEMGHSSGSKDTDNFWPVDDWTLAMYGQTLRKKETWVLHVHQQLIPIHTLGALKDETLSTAHCWCSNHLSTATSDFYFFYNFCIFIKNCFRHLKDLFPKIIQYLNTCEIF